MKPEPDPSPKKSGPTHLYVLQIGCSVSQVVEVRRKTEVVERHVPQVVLRGEHVAFVQIL
jgi:hypothetical protein